MSALSRGRPSAQLALLIPILLLFGLFCVAVIRSPSLISSSGLGSALIVAAPLILATYALTVIVMAGRGGVDLSIGPLIGFINVTLVQLHGAGVVVSPFQTFLYVFIVGVAYQLLMGLVIVYVRIQPIIVALSGYLTLSGLNLIILPRPGGVAPPWMSSWGLGESVWSPVLLILVVATAAWFGFRRTAFHDHLRLMGSDERTAYASGVNITIVRLGAHVIAGLFAGLAALTFTSLIGSGDPTQGSTYTLLTVTALVLGGTSLAGGRGSIVGSLLGALNIYLITYVLATFSFGMIQSFVTEVSYGLILVGALLLTILLPQIQSATRRLSPVTVFVFLGLAGLGVMLYAKDAVRAERVAAAAAQRPAGTSLAGQSLAGRSLAAQAGGASVASQSAGTSLATQTGGTSLAAQTGGTSLAAQAGGTSLAAQTGGTSLAGRSLAGGSSLAGAADARETPTAGTPVVIAVVVIGAGLFAVWLVYRHFNLFSVAVAAVMILMLIGYGAHDGAAPAADPAPVAARSAAPSFFWPSAIDPGPQRAPSMFASPWVSVAAFLAGSLVVGTVLILTTIPAASARIGGAALRLIAGGAAAVALLLVYESGAFARGDGRVPEGLVPILLGAVLFVLTLPGFARRLADVTTVMIGLLSLTALGAAFFATRPTGAGAPPSPVPSAPAVWTPPEIVAPAAFHVQSFALLTGAAILFLLLMPGVRRHVLRNLSPEPRAGVSYTGLFIAGFAALTLGAVFAVAGVPVWKFIVALVAGVIGARALLHFLQDFRRRTAAGATR